MAQSLSSKEAESKLNGPSRALQSSSGSLAERFESFSHEAGKKIGTLASSVSDSTNEVLEASRSYIREKPLRTTAIAAAAGLAAGLVISMFARRK